MCYSLGCHLSRTHAKTRARVLSSSFWTPSRYLLFFRGEKITQFARTRVHNILHSLTLATLKAGESAFITLEKLQILYIIYVFISKTDTKPQIRAE